MQLDLNIIAEAVVWATDEVNQFAVGMISLFHT